jgi:hypothetical protein
MSEYSVEWFAEDIGADYGKNYSCFGGKGRQYYVPAHLEGPEIAFISNFFWILATLPFY